jgi:hypothetical protein
MAMVAAFYLAASTGWGVYRSCTKYKETMGFCLAIDAIFETALIVAFHFFGIW